MNSPVILPVTMPPKIHLGEKGKLYRWNGTSFEEVLFDGPAERKLPVTEEAFEAVKQVRQAVHAQLGMRPELSVVASAMVLLAGKNPELMEAVTQYGLRMYSQRVGADPSPTNSDRP